MKFSIALQAQIYLITKSFGGRQAVGESYADFVESSPIQWQNSVQSSGKQKYLPTSQVKSLLVIKIWAVSAIEFET
jgi:hypothetical protein